MGQLLILNSLDLPQDLHLEFLVHHNQVVRDHPGGINPYYLGFKIWHDILRRFDEPTPEEIETYGLGNKAGQEALFEVCDVDRDASFIRRVLTESLMREMDIFEHHLKGEHRIVTRVSDEDNWQDVKQSLINNVGMATVPVIKVVDADFGRSRVLYMKHVHDGRDLDLAYAEKTLGYAYQLWGRKVHMETISNQ